MEYQGNSADLMDLAAQIFAGTVTSYDTAGHYSGAGYNGQALAGVPIARPYGYRARAPANTGLVLAHTVSGLLVLSERNNLPAGVTEPADGEALLYNAQAAQVRLDENGDIVLTPKSGEHVKIGGVGATDPVALSTQTDTELGNIVTAFNAHIHSDPVAGVTSAPTVSMPAPTSVKAQKVVAI
jgi:phage gp45-like